MTTEFYYDENRNLVEGVPPSKVISDEIGIQHTVDANGNVLVDGDNIIAIKGLPVKGGVDIKQGDVYKNIKLTDDFTHVSAKCKNNGKIFLKTAFFRKVS